MSAMLPEFSEANGRWTCKSRNMFCTRDGLIVGVGETRKAAYRDWIDRL